jgi:hypothetical protein
VISVYDDCQGQSCFSSHSKLMHERLVVSFCLYRQNGGGEYDSPKTRSF